MDAGEWYSLLCLASKTISGLTNTPSLEWLDKEGSPVTTGGPVTVGELTTHTLNVSLSLTFSSLHISHAGQYTCQATLSSPALDTPLEKNTTSDVTLQSKQLSQELFMFLRYSHTCQHAISHLNTTLVTLHKQLYYIPFGKYVHTRSCTSTYCTDHTVASIFSQCHLPMQFH